MRTLLTTLAFTLAFSASAAYAQNKIIVIDETGKVSEIDIGPSPMAPAPKAPEKQAAPEAAPVPAATPEPAPVAKPTKKPAPKKEVVKKEAPAAKKADAAPKKKSTKKVDQKKQAAPATAKPVKQRPPREEYVSPRPQRMGPSMTPEDAIRIALDVAPPARSVTASPVNYKGLHAYEVVFRTENGDQFVYVDRDSGKVVK